MVGATDNREATLGKNFQLAVVETESSNTSIPNPNWVFVTHLVALDTVSFISTIVILTHQLVYIECNKH